MLPFKIIQASVKEIEPYRNLFLQEFNRQFICNAYHERNWSDVYLIISGDKMIGYGAINGSERTNRDTIFEFYLLPSFRNRAHLIFPQLAEVSKARYVICQSNDLFLTSMLYEFAQHIHADVILFESGATTQYVLPGITFRRRRENDIYFEHKHEPDGDYVLEAGNEIVATGGFLLHYNMPFADLFMEVKEEHRRKGYGSYLIQELKKECYLHQRVPAARCSIKNKASRATLLKGGLKIAGFELTGDILIA